MDASDIGKDGWRIALLCVFILATLIAALTSPPISQNLAYHSFVDTRSFLGVPNFLDVMSNIAFIVIGPLGVRRSIRHCPKSTRPAWMLLFVAVMLVGVGSAHYHWAPDNDSLMWDRLPMTVGFMALSVALLGEYLDRRLVKVLLYPAVLTGVSSVIYWRYADDLRFYAWVQFMPLGIVVLLLALFRSRFEHNRMLIIAVGFYMLAKVFEFFDGEIFSLSHQLVSGHTLKHLSVAACCMTLVILLQKLGDKCGTIPAQRG